MKYLIVEDETLAYKELERMVGHLRPDYELVGWANSVQTATELLRIERCDLIFMDIRLGDGLSFDIFHIVPTNIPVIFTTAYDEYALRAFKTNSVDYLLKPIDEDELAQALEKFEANYLSRTQGDSVRKVENEYAAHCKRQRFLVTLGDEYRYVPVGDIRCFMSEEKSTCMYVRGGKQYVLSYPLDTVEQMLDERDFCRISRNCIAHIDAIARCHKYFGGRLSVRLSADCPQDSVIVSRGRTAEVLAWLGGEEGRRI